MSLMRRSIATRILTCPAHLFSLLPVQVGACIVDANNVICGIGYNGFPRGCADSEVGRVSIVKTRL